MSVVNDKRLDLVMKSLGSARETLCAHAPPVQTDVFHALDSVFQSMLDHGVIFF